jgi:hypothetical protein
MPSTPYPNLQDIYLRRLKKARLWQTFGFAASVVFFGLLWPYEPPTGSEGEFYLGISFLAMLYFGVLCVITYSGIYNFHIHFQKLLDETSADKLDALNELEAELTIDQVFFDHVIFTQSFLLVFKEVGSFARVRDIQLVQVRVRYLPFYGTGQARQRSYKELSCTVESLGCVVLSTDLAEMNGIIDEIRSRNLLVQLDEESTEVLATST